MKLKAIGNKVIMKKKEKETVTESGIILEYENKHEYDRAWVLSAGSACESVKKGDLVTFVIKNKDAGQIKDQKTGETYIILREDQIAAIIEEE